ncbi:hypothetical protein V6Z11_D06G071100 [Gossypium hirsutum]|uniref:Uncharacterized protein n=2 Tax=Gossypium TaxID=3633 RepID=A0A5D2KFC2_GOSTO|nr:hypothetical protein ES288_D06G076500v1 [Gossypium darwinii]TYH65767.1 hypothetical protein ES332_D06G077800v1 [Gossypium tomentosum]
MWSEGLGGCFLYVVLKYFTFGFLKLSSILGSPHYR